MTPAALLLAACCEAPPAGAIDIALRLGPTYSLGAPLPRAISDQRLGMEAALQLHYRFRYFLTPFIEAGYARLGAGSASVPRHEPGGPGTLSTRLDAWHATAGLTYTLWRAHLGVALGIYDFGIKSQLAGITSNTFALSLGMDALVGITVIEAPRFSARIELVTHNGLTADLHYLQAGIAIHGDVARWWR